MKHIEYFDTLRVLSILAVIIQHVAINGMYDNTFSLTFIASNLWICFCLYAVPCFVMISGTLFLDPQKIIDLKKLYFKNIFSLIRVFIIWSFIYAFAMFLVGESSRGNLHNFLSNFIMGTGHLWFLYMLVGLYILVPLLRPITNDIKLTRYFLILSFVFSFLFPTVIQLLTGISLITDNSFVNKFIEIFKSILTDRIHFHFTLEYVSYFVLGYYLNYISFKKYQRILIYITGILSALWHYTLISLVSTHINTLWHIYTNSNLTINVLLESIAVFVFMKYNTPLLSKNGKRIFAYFSSDVIGIYLVHMIILIGIVKILRIDILNYNPLFSIPITAFIIFILSFICIEIIKKIPFLNKSI